VLEEADLDAPGAAPAAFSAGPSHHDYPASHPDGSPDFSADGSPYGSPDFSADGSPYGSPYGSPDGSPYGSPYGSPDGCPDFSPPNEGPDGSVSWNHRI
jgi:hypothetical protein